MKKGSGAAGAESDLQEEIELPMVINRMVQIVKAYEHFEEKDKDSLKEAIEKSIIFKMLKHG